jgi:hypothetical protein
VSVSFRSLSPGPGYRPSQPSGAPAEQEATASAASEDDKLERGRNADERDPDGSERDRREPAGEGPCPSYTPDR